MVPAGRLSGSPAWASPRPRRAGVFPGLTVAENLRWRVRRGPAGTPRASPPRPVLALSPCWPSSGPCRPGRCPAVSSSSSPSRAPCCRPRGCCCSTRCPWAFAPGRRRPLRHRRRVEERGHRRRHGRAVREPGAGRRRPRRRARAGPRGAAGTPDELSGEAFASSYLGADDPGARPLPGAPSTAREQLAVRLAGVTCGGWVARARPRLPGRRDRRRALWSRRSSGGAPVRAAGRVALAVAVLPVVPGWRASARPWRRSRRCRRPSATPPTRSPRRRRACAPAATSASPAVSSPSTPRRARSPLGWTARRALTCSPRRTSRALFRTVVGQVNGGAGETVLDVPEAEAQFPGSQTSDAHDGAALPGRAGRLAGWCRHGERRRARGRGQRHRRGAVGDRGAEVGASTTTVGLSGDPGAGSTTATARTSVARVLVAGVLGCAT